MPLMGFLVAGFLHAFVVVHQQQQVAVAQGVENCRFLLRAGLVDHAGRRPVAEQAGQQFAAEGAIIHRAAGKAVADHPILVAQGKAAGVGGGQRRFAHAARAYNGDDGMVGG